MSERYLPVDSDAERAVIASILTSPDAFYEVSLALDAEDFSLPLCSEVMRAALACDAMGKAVDQITVADQMRKGKVLSKVGGVKALAELVEEANAYDAPGSYAEIVREKSLLRRLVSAGRQIAGEAMKPEVEGKEALSEAERVVFDLGKERRGESLVEMPQVVSMLKEELERTRSSLLVGVSTGFSELDKMTGGFQGGQFIVVAARPSVGKSAWALQLARHLAETTGKKVPFLSYEMGTNELSMRMLSAALSYDMHKLRRGDLPPGMEKDLADEVEKMAGLTLMVDDNPPETIDGVRSQLRRLARRDEVGAVVIDYLQLLSSERKGRDENRTQEVSEISRKLKRLASELDVPVIALSQLNRALESRPNKRPMLSDLRESGSIEQDASLVMFLYRDSLYNAAADPTLAELIIAKQRNGPTGTVYLEFLGESAKFKDTTKRPAASPGGGGIAGGIGTGVPGAGSGMGAGGGARTFGGKSVPF